MMLVRQDDRLQAEPQTPIASHRQNVIELAQNRWQTVRSRE
jgi:hypothetical protein